jgi:hypothetical protein
LLIFIREQYHPDPLLLGLAAAGTESGALIAFGDTSRPGVQQLAARPHLLFTDVISSGGLHGRRA